MTGTEAQLQSFVNGRVHVVVGDITRENVAAIVNAANSSLQGGGGVDGAIHRAGGPIIFKNSLLLATKHSLSSIAFPAISTGVYDYPRAEAAKVSSQTIKEFLAGDDTVKEVRLVFFQSGDARVFIENQKFE